MKQLDQGIFKNDFVASFKGDESGDLHPRQTPGVLYSKALPTPVQEPRLLAWSAALGEELGIAKPNDASNLDILAGNHITPSMYPYAACYAGHQFGNWAGQLGDGRAITLGEWPSPNGKNCELQLKGAGLTPYSRRADGRAVLRSSVREYLMSEAMYYLGVPTTRALSLVTTGEPVLRDMFYNGNAAYEPGAIVMRVAPSFLRFGSFEMPAARKELLNLKQLVDWTIERFYPHLLDLQGPERIVRWYKEIVERTANLMVEWMRVGFVHGVMNTDNMSILGLTIDYGPYSFLDDYDTQFTPNTTDLPGRRYAFGRQAPVAQWNLACLAGALSPLLPDTKPLEAELQAYQDIFWSKYYVMMGRKLGFDRISNDDINLIVRFEKVLDTLKPDMTIFFQQLISLPAVLENENQVVGHFTESFYNELIPAESTLLWEWLKEYSKRLQADKDTPEQRVDRMKAANPRFILRNYLLHQAIEELEKGENKLFTKLHEAIKTPYSDAHDEFFVKRPDWAGQKAGCSMLSCSS